MSNEIKMKLIKNTAIEQDCTLAKAILFSPSIPIIQCYERSFWPGGHENTKKLVRQKTDIYHEYVSIAKITEKKS